MDLLKLPWRRIVRVFQGLGILRSSRYSADMLKVAIPDDVNGILVKFFQPFEAALGCKV